MFLFHLLHHENGIILKRRRRKKKISENNKKDGTNCEKHNGARSRGSESPLPRTQTLLSFPLKSTHTPKFLTFFYAPCAAASSFSSFSLCLFSLSNRASSLSPSSSFALNALSPPAASGLNLALKPLPAMASFAAFSL